jgi:16S rRNA (cytosine967-C5)-methyltransferase
VLRRIAGEGEPSPPGDPTLRLLWLESCPQWIYEELAALLSPEEAAATVRAQSEPAPTGVRVSARAGIEDVALRIREERPSAEIVASSLVRHGLIVRGGGVLADTSAFREGLFTLQDPAAQLCSEWLAPEPGDRILDACAGLGGKSTHLAELAQGQAQIDAVDRSEQKLSLLRENAMRLGARGITTHALDMRELPPSLDGYDRALLDAPCSGLGTLRRHPEIKWQREANDVAELAALQAELLERCAERVRPGGVLLYSVCTLTVREGPGQIAWFLGEHDDWEAMGGPRITLPQRDGADGFFLARLKRRGHS